MLHSIIADTMMKRKTLLIKNLAPIDFTNTKDIEQIDITDLPKHAQGLGDEDVIAAPLFGTFDAFEIAGILQDNHYQGTFLAISPVLPARDQIIHEIRKQFPKVKFDIVEAQDL
ncbi:hypothetical protein [Pseudaestuariivita rosea]|uniref:hypothetical protein n=1 Tax=Pseudaestuariivita rosea TaxID=2763263 RepID=UPI001ABB6F17|nr:hypothetical protein [Pseudaestuariivita rosea]